MRNVYSIENQIPQTVVITNVAKILRRILKLVKEFNFAWFI